eukprot:509848_1
MIGTDEMQRAWHGSVYVQESDVIHQTASDAIIADHLVIKRKAIKKSSALLYTSNKQIQNMILCIKRFAIFRWEKLVFVWDNIHKAYNEWQSRLARQKQSELMERLQRSAQKCQTLMYTQNESINYTVLVV